MASRRAEHAVGVRRTCQSSQRRNQQVTQEKAALAQPAPQDVAASKMPSVPEAKGLPQEWLHCRGTAAAPQRDHRHCHTVQAAQLEKEGLRHCSELALRS